MRRVRHSVLLAAAGAVAAATPAMAVTIELKDAAPARVENQRLLANGATKLPGAPDTSAFDARMEAKGLKLGSAMLIRIFKSEAELEIWVQKGETFELFSTYPICNWSGTLGPKLAEGDKQTPEGFYSVASRQLHRIGRWPRSLNLGFPNVYDQSLARTGSYILVHGGCSSVGCFAMTNPVIEEIFRLTKAAIDKGQHHVPVHVFPFRMTDANLAKYDKSEWSGFWRNLKEGYDVFNETRLPPRVRVCDGRYQFDRAAPGEGAGERPLEACGETIAAIQALDEFYAHAKSHPLLSQIDFKTRGAQWTSAASDVPQHLTNAFEIYRDAMVTLSRAVEENAKLPRAQRMHPRLLARAVAKSYQYKCNSTLPSCRRFIALHKSRVAASAAAGTKGAARRRLTNAARGGSTR